MRSVYRSALVLVLAAWGVIAVGGGHASACDGAGKGGMAGQSAMAKAMMANQMAKNGFGQFGGGNKGFGKTMTGFAAGKQGGGAKFAGQAGRKK